ncbi:Hypothetical_protein [Hexamita inflata]|uniref:Hypothetical_protein n=1 Tax=Hexamita inflata TaxID=28002 RepID=A0AA86RVR5_9EUKA|nr:Hypothetical protein HINF_LOCUS61120 [Hexamita inflata]
MNFSSYLLSGPLTFSGFDQRDYNAKRELYSKNTPQNKTVPSQTNQNTTKTDEKNQKTVQKQEIVAQNATNSKQSPQNKREILTGQLITLSNGEVGVFIPLTQSQQRQVNKVVRDYYQKSFLRCMFQECISSQDKVLLCNLINQMEGQKPSVIADRFFESVGTDKYFKRNVVMYIVNRKSK